MRDSQDPNLTTPTLDGNTLKILTQAHAGSFGEFDSQVGLASGRTSVILNPNLPKSGITPQDVHRINQHFFGRDYEWDYFGKRAFHEGSPLKGTDPNIPLNPPYDSRQNP